MKEFSDLAHFFVAGSAPRRRRESYALLRCSPAPRTALKSENSCFKAERRKFKDVEGFTFIEVILTGSILAVIAAIGIVSFLNSRNTHDLTTSRQTVISIIRAAQSRTLAGQDGSAWGVRLQQTQIVLFRGSSYASATQTATTSLPHTVEITSIALTGGGSDIVFKQPGGETDQDGSFIVRVKDSSALTGSLIVEKSGKVYESQTASATAGTRVMDTRHRAYRLGWSIRNSTNLVLTFSDPPFADTVVTIPMAGYFNQGQTEFDWSGTNTIGGADQVLRVHTDGLSASDTALSIDRDCRFNTKKVQVKIDTSVIATYEADCRTLTLGAAGGTISEP